MSSSCYQSFRGLNFNYFNFIQEEMGCMSSKSTVLVVNTFHQASTPTPVHNNQVSTQMPSENKSVSTPAQDGQEQKTLPVQDGKVIGQGQTVVLPGKDNETDKEFEKNAKRSDLINSSFLNEQQMDEGVRQKHDLGDKQEVEEQAELNRDWKEVDVQFQIYCRDKAHANDHNFYAHQFQSNEKGKWDSILSLMPSSISAALSDILNCLLQADNEKEIKKAYETLGKLKNILMTGDFCARIPVNLYVEQLSNENTTVTESKRIPTFLSTTKKHKITDMDEEDATKPAETQVQDNPQLSVKTFTRTRINPSSSMQDILITKVTRRHLHQWKKEKEEPVSASCLHNAFAITSLFVLNGGPKVPVIVTNNNISSLNNFLRLSLELGGFPLIKPVYDPAVAGSSELANLRYLVRSQNVLVTHNWSGFKGNQLHIMAEQKGLSEEQKPQLRAYLKTGSMQCATLLQPDYRSMTPLTAAFLSGNADFVLEVFRSKDCVAFDFKTMFYRDEEVIADPLNAFFVPPSLDQLSKKRNKTTNQIDIFIALRAYLEKRSDLKQLLIDSINTNAMLLRGLDPYGNLDIKEQVASIISKVYGIKTITPELFQEFANSQKWVCEVMQSAAVKAMSLVDQLMFSYFGSALRQYGLCVIQLAASSTYAELQKLQQCPGIQYILFHQIAPGIKAQSSLETLIKLDANTLFPRYHQNKSRLLIEEHHCQISAISLATNFQPKAVETHVYLAEQADHKSMIKTFQFETLVLVGEALGTQAKLFTQLFLVQPWLYGVVQDDKWDEFNVNEKETDKSQHYKHADNLLQRLGKVMIENHDYVKFEEFVLSLRRIQVHKEIVGKWFSYCLMHFAPKCYVPIFAVFARKLQFTLADLDTTAFDRLFLQERNDRPHLKNVTYTREDVQLAIRMNDSLIRRFKLAKSARNGQLSECSLITLDQFFEGALDSFLSDYLVDFILCNNLIQRNFGSIDAEYVSQFIRRQDYLNTKEQDSLYPVKIRFRFYKCVFTYCSLSVMERFIRSEVNLRAKFGYIGSLFPLFILNAAAEAAQPRDQSFSLGLSRVKPSKLHGGHFQRQATLILPKMLDNATCFPQQVKLLQQSMQNKEMAQDLADHLGVSVTNFTKAAKSALEFVSKQSTRGYRADELFATPTAALIIQDDKANLPTVSAAKDLLRISKTTIPVMQSPLHVYLVERKFDAIYDIFETFIKQSSHAQLITLLYWLGVKVHEDEMQMHEKLIEVIKNLNINYRHGSWGKEDGPFMIGARIQLTILRVLHEKQRVSLPGFADKLLAIGRHQKDEFATFILENKALLEFLYVSENLQERLEVLYAKNAGNKHKQIFAVKMLKEYYAIVGDDLPDVLAIQAALLTYKDFFNIDSEDEEESAEENRWRNKAIDFVRNQSENSTNFFRKFMNIAVWGIYGLQRWNLTNQAKNISQERNELFKQCFDGLMPLIAKHYARIVKVFQLIQANIQHIDETHLCRDVSAQLFSLMTPQQLETVVNCEVNIFPFQCRSINIISLFTRNDLSKPCFKRILEKAMEADFELDLPNGRAIMLPSAPVEGESQSKTPNKLLHILIHCGALTNGQLSVSDLPEAMQKATDERHLFRAIITKSKGTSSDLLPLIQFLTSKLSVSKFLAFFQQQDIWLSLYAPQVFSFFAMHVGKNEPVMNHLLKWIADNGEGGRTALQIELASEQRQNVKGRLLSNLMTQGRHELIEIVKKHASKAEWDQLVQERAYGYSGKTGDCWMVDLKEPIDLLNEDEESNQGSVAEEDTRRFQADALAPEYYEQQQVTPFFMALNHNRFDLCQMLHFNQKLFTLCEFSILISTIKKGINPISLENQPEFYKRLQNLQQWLSKTKPDISAQSFGTLQLFAILPTIAPALLRFALHQEPDLIETEKKFLLSDTDALEDLAKSIKSNGLRRLIIEEASQDAQVLKFFIDVGLIQPTDTNAFLEAFDENLLDTHVQAESFLLELVSTFPVGQLGGKAFMAEMGMGSRDQTDVEGGRLASLLGVQVIPNSFDRDAAYKALLLKYSTEFLGSNSKLDMSEFDAVGQIQKVYENINIYENWVNEDEEEFDENEYLERIDKYEQMLRNLRKEKRARRQQIYDKLANSKIVSNIFSKEAESTETFIQMNLEMVNSSDHTTTYALPRNIWRVNEQFKAKTTNDITRFAAVWLKLMLHFGLHFDQVLPSLDAKKQFTSLLFELRADTYERMEKTAALMRTFAKGHVQFAFGADEVSAEFEAGKPARIVVTSKDLLSANLASVINSALFLGTVRDGQPVTETTQVVANIVETYLKDDGVKLTLKEMCKKSLKCIKAILKHQLIQALRQKDICKHVLRVLRLSGSHGRSNSDFGWPSSLATPSPYQQQDSFDTTDQNHHRQHNAKLQPKVIWASSRYNIDNRPFCDKLNEASAIDVDAEIKTLDQLSMLFKILSACSSFLKEDSSHKITFSNSQAESLVVTSASEHEKTLTFNTQALHDKAMLQQILKEAPKYFQFPIQCEAQNFVKEISNNFESICGYTFKEFKLKHGDLAVVFPEFKSDTERFDFLGKISAKKPKRYLPLEPELPLQEKDKDFLKMCTLEISFVTKANYSATETFTATLKQITSNAQTLSLVLLVDSGAITVCTDSYQPLIQRALQLWGKMLVGNKLSCHIAFNGLLDIIADQGITNLPDTGDDCLTQRFFGQPLGGRTLMPLAHQPEFLVQINAVWEDIHNRLALIAQEHGIKNVNFFVMFTSAAEKKAGAKAGPIQINSIEQQTVDVFKEVYDKYFTEKERTLILMKVQLQ